MDISHFPGAFDRFKLGLILGAQKGRFHRLRKNRYVQSSTILFSNRWSGRLPATDFTSYCFESYSGIEDYELKVSITAKFSIGHRRIHGGGANLYFLRNLQISLLSTKCFGRKNLFVEPWLP
jgi:hypothetical protein